MTIGNREYSVVKVVVRKKYYRKRNEKMKKIILCALMLLSVATFSACGTSKKDNKDDADVTKEPVATEDANTTKLYNDENIEDTYIVEEIIDRKEVDKATGEYCTDEEIAGFEKVPNSKVTYVAVDGLGEVYGMGVHFQEFAVGVGAKPVSGYRYAGCESETIEFYEYAPNEYLGYDVPWFLVPDSGEHIIYVYFEPVE